MNSTLGIISFSLLGLIISFYIVYRKNKNDIERVSNEIELENQNILKSIEEIGVSKLGKTEAGKALLDSYGILPLQLPSPPDNFTGRERELEELVETAQKGDLLLASIRGISGIGKTALALKLAQKITPNYPDAQLFLSMYGANDSQRTPLSFTEAMKHIIRSFHPTTKLPDDPAQLAILYRSTLINKKALLFFDNVRDAAQVEPLLPPSTCFTLITTQNHFSLPGLHEIDLDTLPIDDATELVCKIAPRASGQAAEISKACGHIPLALRLIASIIHEQKEIDVSDILNRFTKVDQHFGTISKVEVATHVSYKLLPELLQKAFRMLAIFPSNFNLQATSTVWNIPSDIAKEYLNTMTRANLIDSNVVTKRYQLHSLIRSVAKSLENEKEEYQAGSRYSNFYLQILDLANNMYESGGKNVMMGLSLFDLEWTNIHAGQAWAVTQKEDRVCGQLCVNYPISGSSCLALRLHPRELINWLDSALEASNKINDQTGKEIILNMLGNAYADINEHGEAIKYYQLFLKNAKAIDNQRVYGIVLNNLGSIYYNLGQYKEAIKHYQQQLVIAHEINDKRAEGVALGNLGLALADLGQNKEAIKHYQQQLKISCEIGDRRAEGLALGNLGLAYSTLGFYNKAIEFHYRHLEIAHEIGDQRSEVAALGNLGDAYANLNKYQKAIELFMQALAISREIGDRRGEGNALGNLGIAYANLEQYDKAIEHYNQQLEITHEIGDRRGEANASWNLGGLLANQGKLKKAISLMQVLVDFLTEIGHPDAEKRAAQVEELKNN